MGAIRGRGTLTAPQLATCPPPTTTGPSQAGPGALMCIHMWTVPPHLHASGPQPTIIHVDDEFVGYFPDNVFSLHKVKVIQFAV